MHVTISFNNTKLGLIPSVSVSPGLSCRENCPCTSECYACKGNYSYKNVQLSLYNNLQIYLTNADKYFNEILYEIDNGINSYKYFRWHVAGDIVDREYLDRMYRMAKRLPNTKFLAFTKKFELVNEYIDKHGLLNNFVIVLSAWDKDFVFENPHNLPVAYILFKDESRNVKIPPNAILCNGDCTHCLMCWDLKLGDAVVFHKH